MRHCTVRRPRFLASYGWLYSVSENGQHILFGTNDGVYLSADWGGTTPPVKVLTLLDVTHLDVLDEHKLLIVVSGPCIILKFEFIIDIPSSFIPQSAK